MLVKMKKETKINQSKAEQESVEESDGSSSSDEDSGNNNRIIE